MARTGRPRIHEDRSCDNCGAVFAPKEGTQRFCSRDCWTAKGRQGRSRVCEHCGAEFHTRYASVEARFCSRDCYAHAREGKRRPHAWRNRARTMSEPEAAWLAGLFDGEGSVVDTHKGRAATTCRINIYNSCLPLLERVQAVAGCGSVHERAAQKAHHSRSFYWQTYGRTAAAILEQMLPWLIVKRERAEEIVGRYAHDGEYEALGIIRPDRQPSVRSPV